MFQNQANKLKHKLATPVYSLTNSATNDHFDLQQRD